MTGVQTCALPIWNAPGGALPQSQSFQNGAIRHGLTLPTGTPRTSGRPHDKRASHLPSNGNRKDQRRHVHEDVDADVQPLRSKRVKVRRYRLGRLMGRLIAFTGLLLVLAGLGSLGVGLAFLWLKVGPADIAALLSFNPLVAAGMAILGCVLILLSQIAKAVFDAARDRVSEPHA